MTTRTIIVYDAYLLLLLLLFVFIDVLLLCHGFCEFHFSKQIKTKIFIIGRLVYYIFVVDNLSSLLIYLQFLNHTYEWKTSLHKSVLIKGVIKVKRVRSAN